MFIYFSINSTETKTFMYWLFSRACYTVYQSHCKEFLDAKSQKIYLQTFKRWFHQNIAHKLIFQPAATIQCKVVPELKLVSSRVKILAFLWRIFYRSFKNTFSLILIMHQSFSCFLHNTVYPITQIKKALRHGVQVCCVAGLRLNVSFLKLAKEIGY